MTAPAQSHRDVPQGASRYSIPRRAQNPESEKARRPKRVCVDAAGRGGTLLSPHSQKYPVGWYSCSIATDCWMAALAALPTVILHAMAWRFGRDWFSAGKWRMSDWSEAPPFPHPKLLPAYLSISQRMARGRLSEDPATWLHGAGIKLGLPTQCHGSSRTRCP